MIFFSCLNLWFFGNGSGSVTSKPIPRNLECILGFKRAEQSTNEPRETLTNIL